MKRRRLDSKGGGAMVLTPKYTFIDSHQLEAVVGSNDLFILACHVLGSVDAML